jgi:hypothetical protein
VGSKHNRVYRSSADPQPRQSRKAMKSAAPDPAPLLDVIAEPVVSSIEGVEGNVPDLEPTPVIPSSQDSASSQSGSDSQNQIAKIALQNVMSLISTKA